MRTLRHGRSDWQQAASKVGEMLGSNQRELVVFAIITGLDLFLPVEKGGEGLHFRGDCHMIRVWPR